MLVLVAAQLLVFNHIHLFGYATPLPFVYFLLRFPLNTERWSILLWGFVCGLLTDIISLTPGIGSAAMTMTAFVQPLLLNLMVPKDAVEDFRPGYRTLGFWPYVYYVTQLTFLFTLIYFLLLSFSFHHFLDFIISFVSSWALTLLLCLIFEGFHKKGHE
jgi:rod shape-determining protein MreD